MNIHHLQEMNSMNNLLFEDIKKLDALYEELCWAHDDELVFTHENGRVIIYNKTQQDKESSR
jgi:hypothetical protein